jgi:hypothetical protein
MFRVVSPRDTNSRGLQPGLRLGSRLLRAIHKLRFPAYLLSALFSLLSSASTPSVDKSTAVLASAQRHRPAPESARNNASRRDGSARWHYHVAMADPPIATSSWTRCCTVRFARRYISPSPQTPPWQNLRTQGTSFHTPSTLQLFDIATF